MALVIGQRRSRRVRSRTAAVAWRSVERKHLTARDVVDLSASTTRRLPTGRLGLAGQDSNPAPAD
jgi:hypothetical protein